MTGQELAQELSVTACAVSVNTALEALEIAANQAADGQLSALARGNDQAYELFEREEKAYRRAYASLSQSLKK